MFGQVRRTPQALNVHTSRMDQQTFDPYTGNSPTTTPTPTNASASGLDQNRSYGRPAAQYGEATEEALLDLAQLEEVHEEAERMKLLGNKRMANQEFAAAYNAYSQALQLSPVGPSSHVFLSNRAAALLSLKKYESAATDAKRAVALAPTFGKAHARLGQALYFLRRYDEAVEAYKDALEHEPDNEVTRTYLKKAMAKLERETKSRASSDWESVNWQDSVATDPQAKHTVVSRLYNPSTDRAAVLSATAKQEEKPVRNNSANQEEDPEFNEAVKIQQRANSFLIQKKYKPAIEEYTAALFLVPDDPQLSSDLHLGRAHALNGSRRHDAARNDATMAIKLAPSPAAYSTLAKTLFYLKDYQGCIDAFRECEKILPEGEMLGSFDTAYFEKASRMLHDDIGSVGTRKSKCIPKLPPPRFVPREQAMASPANAIRSLPKSWPQQTLLQTGIERTVMCLSESLGVKLNRGSDGIVRVLTVSEDGAMRQGEIYPGDVVREAAGVDLRRPITNVMWGDTVALIKMAARPIAITVAEELSETPQTVIDEQRKAMSPSNASDERAVIPNDEYDTDEDIVEVVDAVTNDIVEILEESMEEENDVGINPPQAAVDANDHPIEPDPVEPQAADPPIVVAPPPQQFDAAEGPAEVAAPEPVHASVVTPMKGEVSDDDLHASIKEDVEPPDVGNEEIRHPNLVEDVDEDGNDSITSLEADEPRASDDGPEEEKEVDSSFEMPQNSLRNEEAKIVGGELLFRRDAQVSYHGWDTLRWMAYNGARKVNLRQQVFRQTVRKGLPAFWKSGLQYEDRTLIVYDEPNLMFIVRRPITIEEIQTLLGLPGEPESEGWALNTETALQSYWIVESVAVPASSKLRLSPLTTATSGLQHKGDRERSCFQILTPTEEIVLSAIHHRPSTKGNEQSYTDSGAFLETLSIESSIAKSICTAHSHAADLGNNQKDIAWKHQLILGSLHSLVISGNVTALKDGIDHARQMYGDGTTRLPPRIVDAVDDNGYTALYYACSLRMANAVEQLVLAGADIDSQLETQGLSMLHISARRLDDKSLANLLSSQKNLNPNVSDKRGRTPLYIAMVEGSVCDQRNDPSSLDRCIIALETKGGTITTSETPSDARHPVSALAYMWLHQYLDVLLKRSPHRYPLKLNGSVTSASIGASYQYPLHCAIIALRKRLKQTDSPSQQGKADLAKTLSVLLDYGFEPNERIDSTAFGDVKTSLDEFAGYSPIQILAVIALEMQTPQDNSQIGASAVRQELQQAAKCLVENGARLSLDPPTSRRQRRLTTETTPEKESVIQLLTSKLDSDSQVLNLLGGKELLDSANSVWHFMKKIPKSNQDEMLDEKQAIEDTTTAGGSDSLSCAICWSVFGTITNRRHRCRVSSKYVCNDCSTKRLVDDKGDHRISDGQFLLARADSVKQQQVRTKTPPAALAVDSKPKSTPSLSSVRRDRLQAEKSDSSNRDKLFGGLVDAASNYVFGGETEDNVEGLTATLGQTRDALNQRGERLAALGDKSAQMVDASADFAKLATELRKQSEGGFFW